MKYKAGRNVCLVIWTERDSYWQSAENSLNLKANDDKLDAGNWNGLWRPNSNYSGGLFVAGLCSNVKSKRSSQHESSLAA